MPLPDQRSRVVTGALRRVAERGGRVAVHHHLAADGQHVARMGLGEKGVGRFLVHGAVGGHRRGALPDHLVKEQPRHAPPVLGVPEAAFLGKGVSVQPVQQLGSKRGQHLHLREMQMRVDEARHDQVRAMVDDRCAGSLNGNGGKGRGGFNPAFFDQERAVLVEPAGREVVGVFGPTQERQGPAPQDHRAHFRASSNQAVMSWRSSLVTPVLFPGGMA